MVESLRVRSYNRSELDPCAIAHMIGNSRMSRQLLSMTRHPLIKIISRRICELFFIVFIFFVASCTGNGSGNKAISASLTESELQDLSYFLNFLMFENHGAFVAFGSKPLCEISVSDPDSKDADVAFQKWLASLSESERTKIEALRK